MSKRDLFNDEEEEEEEEGFQINQKYAQSYNQWRQGEETEKLKNLYGDDVLDRDDESSESSSDDEFCEPDNPTFNRDFLIALGAVETKGAKVLEERPIFTRDYGMKKAKEERPMTLKDYERHIITERGGKLEDDEEASTSTHQQQGESSAKSELIKAFHADSDSDDDELLTSGLFKKKEQQDDAEKKAEDDDDVVEFLKGKREKVKDSEDQEALSTLRKKWSDPKLSKKDKWLADFFLNQRYLEDEDEAAERAYNEVAIDEETLSDDEKTLEKLDQQDHDFRFRFQDPDGALIKQHSRDVKESVRAKNTKRKQEREAYAQRKREEKEQKRAEIAHLKALKYQEIKDKIEKIKEVSGNDDIDIGDDELEEDFDPAAHDAKMADMFGEDYYDLDVDAEKPVFSDDEDLGLENYDEWVEHAGPSVKEENNDNAGQQEWHGGEEEWEGEGEEQHFDQQEFNMDADYDPSATEEASTSKKAKTRQRKKKSKFEQALCKKKPVFDPTEKGFEEYLDEYYGLDFEDVVGGVATRFKYRQVEPNDFGLSTEDVLNATVPELNKWVSLNRIIRFDRSKEQESRERLTFKKKAEKEYVKQKILPSLYTENPEEAQLAEEEKKRQKNLKKKLRKQKKLEEQEALLKGLEEAREGTKANGESNNKPDEGEEAAENGDKMGVEASVGEEETNENGTEPIVKKKKKKKQKDSEEQSTQVMETEAVSEASTESPQKKKKKKKKKEQEENTQEENNDAIENVVENGKKRPLEQETQEQPKKKKKKHEGAEVNQSENTTKKTQNVEGKNKKDAKKRKEDKKNKNKKYQKGRKNVPRDESFFAGISDARLAAYGANPNKLKRKVRFTKDDL